MINIIILLIILVLIYIFLFLKKEYFQDPAPSAPSAPTKPLPPNETVNLLKAVMDDTDLDIDNATEMIDNSNVMLNSDSENIFDSDKLTTYLDEKILNLQNQYQSDNTQLPSIQDNNYTKYNHQLRLLINSRNLGQNIMLNVLKNKINYILGTFNKIDHIKKKYV